MFELNTWGILPILLILGPTSNINARAPEHLSESLPVQTLLDNAKTSATELDRDAAALVSYTRNHSKWRSESSLSRRIGADISTADDILREMLEMRHIASGAQEKTMDTVSPLLRALVQNTRSMVEHVETDPAGCQSTSCMNYLLGHQKLSEDLSRHVTEAISLKNLK